MEREEESKKLTELLRGKAVQECIRHRDSELVITFTCGIRLYVDNSKNLEFSITES